MQRTELPWASTRAIAMKTSSPFQRKFRRYRDPDFRLICCSCRLTTTSYSDASLKPVDGTHSPGQEPNCIPQLHVNADSSARSSTLQTSSSTHRDRVSTNLPMSFGNASIDARRRNLSILLQSFGFKHGIPTDADFVFDLRCLPNPYWQAELRSLTGLDPAVVNFLDSEESFVRMYEDISGLSEKMDSGISERQSQLPDCRVGMHGRPASIRRNDGKTGPRAERNS